MDSWGRRGIKQSVVPGLVVVGLHRLWPWENGQVVGSWDSPDGWVPDRVILLHATESEGFIIDMVQVSLHLTVPFFY